MLHSGNIQCARWATRLLSCLVLALFSPALRAGDPPQQDAARNAFQTARRWVDAVAVPGADEPAAQVTIEGASGVCVLLRRSGRVVGVGADWTGDNHMLRRAVARALGELLGEPAVQGLPDEMRDMAGRMVSIELDIAGEPEPLVAQSIEQAGRQLDPGVNGIAMRRERDWAYLFPAQFRANNTAGAMHRQFLALATDLQLPAISLADLKRKHNAAAYAFRTITLVQAKPTDTPTVAVRGEDVVPIDAVTSEHLCDWAAFASDQLFQRLASAPRAPDGPDGEPGAREPVGLPGTYNPLADDFNPLIAPPTEQALAAFALGRASHSPALSSSMREQCRAGALHVLLDLTTTTSVETDPIASASTCALIIAALSEVDPQGDGVLTTLHDQAADRLVQSFVPTMSFDSALSPHERAIVAWGLVRLSQRDPLAVPREMAQAAVDQSWSSVNESQRVALLPWVGWATMELARAPGATLSHADELRELASGLCASRVPMNHQPYQADLAGGLPLQAGGRSHPSSQSLRPASWLASAMRDDRIVPADERADRIQALREMMRFVRQLMVREETAWRYRNDRRSQGGFRAATWDVTQPVPAQALGLLTLLEAAETLQNDEKQQPATPESRKSP